MRRERVSRAKKESGAIIISTTTDNGHNDNTIIVTTEARRRKIIRLVAELTILLRAVILWQNFVPSAQTKVQEYAEPYVYTITPAELLKISLNKDLLIL